MSDDIVDVLRSMAAAYPEDIFPTPPPERQAKDGAAAHVLRTVAVPHFTAAADEIEALRSVLYDAICGTSDDPADYGVTLDRQTGAAILGNQEEYDRG